MTEKDFRLWDKEGGKFGEATMIEAFVEFAVVVAVGGVGGAYVTVAGFEEFEDAAFVDYVGTAVVGQGSKQVLVFAVFFVEGAEFMEVFA